ncbi:hypothetical protein ACHAP5_009099 [Fusarium lateritium]
MADGIYTSRNVDEVIVDAIQRFDIRDYVEYHLAIANLKEGYGSRFNLSILVYFSQMNAAEEESYTTGGNSRQYSRKRRILTVLFGSRP